MNVQGAGAVFDADAVTPVRGTVPPRQSTVPSPAPAAVADISAWGELLNKLQQLHQRDPVVFKHAVERMAATAKQHADATGGDDKEALAKLGERLATAASTGDVASLRPAKHHPHHHAARARAGAGTEALLQTLLDQVDRVLGPGVTAANAT